MRVRIFGHRGVAQIPRINPRQMSSDAVEVLVQPPEWGQALDTNGTTPVSSTAQADDAASVIMVQVPDGENIRYRIRPPGDTTDADEDSPILSGMNIFYWGKGWTISIIDAAGTQ